MSERCFVRPGERVRLIAWSDEHWLPEPGLTRSRVGLSTAVKTMHTIWSAKQWSVRDSLVKYMQRAVVAIRIRVLRVRYGLDYGQLVRERWRFAANEALNRWKTGSYRLRQGGLMIALRHHPSPDGAPSNDTWVLREIFKDGAYNVPEAAELPSEPRVVDLGANIGLFAAFIFSHHPKARIVAFEPDHENACLLRASAEFNQYGDRLVIHEACAMPWEGPVRFATGGYQFSRIVDEADGPIVEARGIDIFPFLRDVDLVKIDIEGAEWALLEDPRFGAARNVVMEYHPMRCPGPYPRTLARRLLEERGYRILIDKKPMLWAAREDGYGS